MWAPSPRLHPFSLGHLTAFVPLFQLSSADVLEGLIGDVTNVSTHRLDKQEGSSQRHPPLTLRKRPPLSEPPEVQRRTGAAGVVFGRSRRPRRSVGIASGHRDLGQIRRTNPRSAQKFIAE
jgi:hypothetical protein